MFLSNAAIFAIAVGTLALTPVEVSSPIGPIQAAVLAVGLVIMLAVDLIVLRRVFAPFEQLVRVMGSVDPLRPGSRVDFTGRDPGLHELTRAFNAMAARLEAERGEAGRRLLSAQEAERRRLSRDLHDEVGQLLTAALLTLDGATASPPSEAAASIASARSIVDQALDEVRGVARRLRPVALDDLGLADALTVLAATISRSSGVPVRRHIASDLDGLSGERDLAIYRIAQESLTNAVRHAEATTIELALEVGPGLARLRVTDDGIGYDAGESAGIRGMRERALSVGATLDVRRGAAGGTEVVLEVPTEAAQ